MTGKPLVDHGQTPTAPAGKFLVILRATPEEVERAKDCLDESRALATTVHSEAAKVGV